VRSENFVIYQPASRAVLPLQVIDQTSYVPLLPALNAVGKVGAIQEKRNSLKVWFGETEIEVRADDNRVRLGKNRVTLSRPVRKPHSQWLIPVEFLTASLPQLTHEVIEYKVGMNRLFLGDVRPVTFSLRLDPSGNGARITAQFSEKVTIRTTATDGKWYVYLGDRPVLPLEQSYRFQDPYVSEVVFDDQDGVPKLIISPAMGGLNFYPTTAEDGRLLLADVLKPPPTAPPPQAGAGEFATGPTPAAPGLPEITSPEPEVLGVPGPPLPIVVIDAAHGGDDAGARGRDGIMEKDLAAQLAARVRVALLATRKYRILLTRLGDVNPSFEQREITANTARPVAYVSLHAGDLGSTTPRIAVFSYRSTPLDPDQPLSLLIPWNEVHRRHGERSRELAHLLQSRFAQIPGLAAAPPDEVPVRSLRSIDGPAVAIELGTLKADQEGAALTQVGLQQQLAAAVAAGLEAFRAGTP
jgi:N-acetylmuramoyl-L-alanine amidase